MPVQFVFANFISTQLTQNQLSTDTSINIPAAAAQSMPAVSPGNNTQIALALWDGQNPPEIVYCTNNPQSGILTVARGQEGTSAFSWTAGTQVTSIISAAILNQALAGYINNQNAFASAYLPLAGGTMQGNLILNADPSTSLQAATKHYVDNAGAGFLPLIGGAMSGNINMAGNRILSLPTPATSSEPATKAYSDLNLKLLQDEGVLLTAGSGSAYTVATNTGYGSGGLVEGIRLALRLHTTMLPNATLSVDGTAAINFTMAAPQAGVAGAPIDTVRHTQGEVLSIVYRTAGLGTPEWVIENPAQSASRFVTSTNINNQYSITTGLFIPNPVPNNTVVNFILNAANTSGIGACQLNPDGTGLQPLRPNIGVDFTLNQLAAGNLISARWNLATSEWIVTGVATTPVLFGYETSINLSLQATVNTPPNTLTIAVKAANTGLDPTPQNPVTVVFRNPSQPNGAPITTQIVAPLSINTVAVGASLGTANATPFKFWIVLLYNGGSPVLALFNSLSGTSVAPLTETELVSSTAISAGATSAQTFYSPSGITVSNSPYRSLGFLTYETGLATAGTYNNAPDRVQVYGPGIKKPGDIIGENYIQTGAVGSGSTVFPAGTDVIATNTQGDQYMTLAYTPRSAAHLLEVEAQGFFANNTASTNEGMGLFQDAISNALAEAVSTTTSVASAPLCLRILYRLLAALTGSTTFKIRAGGTAGTTTFNGQAAARTLGGTFNSYMKVKEIAT